MCKVCQLAIRQYACIFDNVHSECGKLFFFLLFELYEAYAGNIGHSVMHAVAKYTKKRAHQYIKRTKYATSV